MNNETRTQFPLSYSLNDGSRSLLDAVFAASHLARGHQHIRSRLLAGSLSRGLLPERASITCSSDETSLLADLDGAVVLLSWHDAMGRVSVSAADEQRAERLVDEISARVPDDEVERSVQVFFTDAQTGRRRVRLDVRPWDEVDDHFPLAVRAALEQLLAHRPSDAVEARRLILWHGQPGTGKTTAIRTLLHAWRDWADGVVVTDADALLADGGYLRHAVIESSRENRWKVIVLEDAETLLQKSRGGAAMSRLLNLCDGLLGQGLRCLFLITTNEPLDKVHPAIVRPGRCLARIEFGPLSPAQAAGLLGRAVEAPMTLAQVMAKEPVEVEAPALVGQYL